MCVGAVIHVAGHAVKSRTIRNARHQLHQWFSEYDVRVSPVTPRHWSWSRLKMIVSGLWRDRRAPKLHYDARVAAALSRTRRRRHALRAINRTSDGSGFSRKQCDWWRHSDWRKQGNQACPGEHTVEPPDIPLPALGSRVRHSEWEREAVRIARMHRSGAIRVHSEAAKRSSGQLH